MKGFIRPPAGLHLTYLRVRGRRNVSGCTRRPNEESVSSPPPVRRVLAEGKRKVVSEEDELKAASGNDQPVFIIYSFFFSYNVDERRMSSLLFTSL